MVINTETETSALTERENDSRNDKQKGVKTQGIGKNEKTGAIAKTQKTVAL